MIFPYWQALTYTAGCCFTSSSTQPIGAGMFKISLGISLYVHSWGVGIIHTIDRAGLTGIIAALKAPYT